MSHRHHALINILESIAAEETALAGIVEAEALKVKAFVESIHQLHHQPKPTVQEFVLFNTSVNRLLITVLAEQIVLLNKLDVTASLLTAEEQEEQEAPAEQAEGHGEGDNGNDEETEEEEENA